jgi:hypothetical protein
VSGTRTDGSGPPSWSKALSAATLAPGCERDVEVGLMLRLRSRGKEAAFAAAPGTAAPPAQIVRVFTDPYLELVRLLREASEIEHALLVQYLYGAFSVKPAYPLIVGFGLPNAHDLLGVAVQEMQHLNGVNQMLGDLAAAPNLIRQDFPYEPDIYPFPLNLEPLSSNSLAKYVYTEAPAGALTPASAQDDASRDFLDRLYRALGEVRPNHLGSLYGTIIERTREVIASEPVGVADLSVWPDRLEVIRSQGEDAHFRFFRDVFMSTHPGFAGHPDVWSLPPGDPAYPSLPLPVNPSAFEGHPMEIEPPATREVAWLGNLHYWVILGLLDLSYRSADPIPMGLAKAHMTGPLLVLGQQIARDGAGLPFDPLSMGYSVGKERAATVRLLGHLARETHAWTERLRDGLPDEFPFEQVEDTIKALDAMAQDGEPPPPGPITNGDGAPTPTTDKAATEFWYEFDDHFLFNPTPELGRAYQTIRGPDYVRTRWIEHRRRGTYPEGFIADVRPLHSGLALLSNEQLALIRRHFPPDQNAALQHAFEAFGQGVLFDARRDPGNKVHMMDTSGPANPPIGYHRWHTLIRAMVVLGIDAAEWEAIDPLVALAWAIQSEAKPLQDTQNPRLETTRLETLRGVWLSKDAAALDAAFDSYPYPDQDDDA